MTRVISDNPKWDWYEAIHTVKSLPGRKFLVTISNDSGEDDPMFFVRVWDVTGYPITCFDDFQADFVRPIGAKEHTRPGENGLPKWYDVLDIGDFYYVTEGISKDDDRYWYFTMGDARNALKAHLKKMK